MLIVHAQLMDKDGNEIDARDATGHTYVATMKAAMVWGGARLRESNNPDVYVLYSFTQSKTKIMAYIGEPIVL